MTPVSMTVQYDQMDENISEMCRNLTANNSLSNSQKLANYFNSFYNTTSLSDNSAYPSASNDGMYTGLSYCFYFRLRKA